jgi:hypothetical protein
MRICCGRCRGGRELNLWKITWPSWPPWKNPRENRGLFKRAQGGQMAALQGPAVEGRRAGVRAERRLRLRVRVRTGRPAVGMVARSGDRPQPVAGSGTLAKQRKIESAICVAILAKMAMLRKNQGMLDGKVAKGMWQCWEMLKLQITRRRGISVRKRDANCKLVDGSSTG